MIDYTELADRFGTPLYVYGLDRVVAARKDLFAALPAGFELYYAVKANPHPDVAQALCDGDGPVCRAEISSTGELSSALAAGFAAGDCLYTGPGKTDTELDQAIRRGVRTFSVESLSDLRHIGAAADRRGLVADCLLRINAPMASAGSRGGVGPHEAPMAGDSGVAIPLILWSEGLVALVIGGLLLTRRWSPHMVLLYVTPAALAVAWAVYENAAILLPNLY